MVEWYTWNTTRGICGNRAGAVNSALGGKVERGEGVKSVRRKKRRRFRTQFKSRMARNRIGNSLCDVLGRKPLHFHVRSIE